MTQPKVILTPSLPQHVKCSGSKVLIHACSRFSGPTTYLLSILYVLTEILSQANAKGKKKERKERKKKKEKKKREKNEKKKKKKEEKKKKKEKKKRR